MKTQAAVTSVAQVTINFLKSEEKVIELGSKAYYSNTRDGLKSVVGKLSDGFNIQMTFTEGREDMTDEVIGTTVNVRFTEEQFEALNERFHEFDTAVGAIVEFKIDGDLRYGTLTVRGQETEAYTLYAEEILNVEPMMLQKVGIVDAKDAVLLRMKSHKEDIAAKSLAATAANRAAMMQNTAVEAGVDAMQYA
jgi:hypothetical protein